MQGRGFYLVGAHGSSESEIARRLSPVLQKPGGTGLRVALSAIVAVLGSLLACGLFALVSIPGNERYGCGGWVLGIIVATVVLTLLPLLGIPQIKRQQANYERKMQQASARWSRLYYCGRDDIVFDPGQNLAVPVRDLASYLYGQEVR
jgi:hypothetical protein